MPGGVVIMDMQGNPVGLPPPASADVNASSGNAPNAAAVATMPAIPGKTNYVTGFEITGGGATAANLVLATLAGLAGGTLTYAVGVVAGVTVMNPPVMVQFSPAVAASAVNTAIVLTVPALGAGNTASIASLHGYAV